MRSSRGNSSADPFDQLAGKLLAAHRASRAEGDAQGRQAGKELLASSRPVSSESPGLPVSASPVDDTALPDQQNACRSDESLHRRVAAAVSEDRRDMALVGRVVFEPDLPLPGLKARLLYEKLSNLAEVRVFDPPADQLESLDDLTRWCSAWSRRNRPRRFSRRSGLAESATW